MASNKGIEMKGVTGSYGYAAVDGSSFESWRGTVNRKGAWRRGDVRAARSCRQS